MDFVSKAKLIAEDAHDGQVDKGGDDYYFHPLAVSRMVNSNAEKAVALLHDVVEDTVMRKSRFLLEFSTHTHFYRNIDYCRLYNIIILKYITNTTKTSLQIFFDF